MISLVLLSWKRHQHIGEIVGSLMPWTRLSEIIVWNNNPDLKLAAPDPRVTIINSGRNFFCFARYAMVPLLRNETVLFHDDDLIVRPPQLEALYEAYSNDTDRIYGPFGKRITNGVLYQPTPRGLQAAGDSIGEVDVLLGRCGLFHRSLYQRALQHIPLPIQYEDDVAFSLAATKVTGKRHMAVNVGPILDICGGDEHSSRWKPGFAEARERVVSRIR